MSETKRSDRLVLGFDLAATFVFALEGSTSAVVSNLDLLGVLVLGFVTALGGGLIRDVLLGDVPPAAMRDTRDLFLAFLGGVVAFVIFDPIARIPSGVLIIGCWRVVSVCGVGGE